MKLREEKYVDPVPTHYEGILGADIGGTNSNFGIFKTDGKKLTLVLSLHAKSQEITDFVAVVKDVLAYVKNTYDITVKKGGFAAAGVVSDRNDYVKPTNVSFAIDAKQIIANTSLTCAFIVNDFEVIGYGLELINPKDLVTINKGEPYVDANKIILGAGTGLGKCIMTFNKQVNRYIPLASEGGHADAAVQTKEGLALVDFIRQTEKPGCNISWEDLLSGNGIKRLYAFFQAQDNPSSKNDGPHPDEIFNARNDDAYSLQTFHLYTKLYARCAKNFALDALALSGVYIAGGIASKNLPLFELPAFMQEFTNCCKQRKVLQKIPIYVIADYNISLYGAAQYMVLENMCWSKSA